MTAIVSEDYAQAETRLRANPIIQNLAAGVVTTPIAEMAHEDGTPRHEFMMAANRQFANTEAANADNPRYTADSGFRAIGTIARAILAERAGIRAAYTAAFAVTDSDTIDEIIRRLRDGENMTDLHREISERGQA
jgi:hypothetical protein